MRNISIKIFGRKQKVEVLHSQDTINGHVSFHLQIDLKTDDEYDTFVDTAAERILNNSIVTNLPSACIGDKVSQHKGFMYFKVIPFYKK